MTKFTRATVALLMLQSQVGAAYAQQGGCKLLGPGAPSQYRQLDADWLEEESGWEGRWSPVNPGSYDGIYRGTFTWPGGRRTADLKIVIWGGPPVLNVTILRTQVEGRCKYFGQIKQVGGPSTAGGTYACDWIKVKGFWSARIDDTQPRC